jgi:glycosyltransferase involved in cell wall biosynthesis
VLAQRGVALELVVVDDGSTDGTPGVLAGFGAAITVLRQPNLGHAAAKNAALPQLRGELVHFLDADDTVPADFLARFVEAARAAPEADVFHGGIRAVDGAGAPLYAQEAPLPLDEDPFHELVLRGSPHVDALVVRRRAVERIGGFDARLRLQVDWDFCLRLAVSGARFRAVPGAVANVVRRPGSVSGLRREELAEAGLAVLERQLAAHGRCAGCARARPGVLAWRRHAVRARAARFARRARLGGGLGRWAGTLAVAISAPRLARAAAIELVAPWRSMATGG